MTPLPLEGEQLELTDKAGWTETADQLELTNAQAELAALLHEKELSVTTFDNCPTCGRRITDYDTTGCEGTSGQRYCLAHVPPDRRASEFPDVPADAWPLETWEPPCILCGAEPHAPGQCR